MTEYVQICTADLCAGSFVVLSIVFVHAHDNCPFNNHCACVTIEKLVRCDLLSDLLTD